MFRAIRVAANVLALLGVAVVLTGCVESPGDPSEQRASTDAVEQTVRDFNAALATADQARLQALAAPSFVLIDEGRFYDLADTRTSIEAVLANGAMTRTPVDLQTELRGDVAWCRYRVVGELRTANETVPLALLEAIVLERIGGVWRIAQVSTIPAASPGS